MVEFKREKLKPKQLLLQLKSYLEAELEEKKKSSFLCLSTSAFCFLDDIFTRNQKLRKQEKPNETLPKIARFGKMTLLNITCFHSASQGLKSRLSLKDE